jgi:hypothetical protein
MFSEERREMSEQKPVPIGATTSAMALDAHPLAISAAARLLGLDAGDWSIIIIGLAFSCLLLTLL